MKSDHEAYGDRQREKARTRDRAQRGHRGGGHWHVTVRSSVVICRACGARVPRFLKPVVCPECGDGALVENDATSQHRSI
jgi:rubrerythrin